MEIIYGPLGYSLVGIILALGTATILLYSRNSKLNKDILTLRNATDTNFQKNEVKKLKFGLKKSNNELEKDFIKQIADIKVEHAQEISEIRDEFRSRQNEDYKKAYEEGKKSVDFELNITPLKKLIDDKGYFRHKKVIELGYSYQLYINGIPCLDRTEVIVERLKTNEINDENVERALDNISKLIDKIPDSRAKIAGSFIDLGKSVKKDKKAK